MSDSTSQTRHPHMRAASIVVIMFIVNILRSSCKIVVLLFCSIKHVFVSQFCAVLMHILITYTKEVSRILIIKFDVCVPYERWSKIMRLGT